ILAELRYELGIRIHAAHLNHGLRKSADSDQRFVESLTRDLKIPIHCVKQKIQKSKGKSSLEEIGREARLKFFIQLAQRLKADAVALGHTRDDLAETVLMRIVRGAGLSGMRGI